MFLRSGLAIHDEDADVSFWAGIWWKGVALFTVLPPLMTVPSFWMELGWKDHVLSGFTLIVWNKLVTIMSAPVSWCAGLCDLQPCWAVEPLQQRPWRWSILRSLTSWADSTIWFSMQGIHGSTTNNLVLFATFCHVEHFRTLRERPLTKRQIPRVARL